MPVSVTQRSENSHILELKAKAYSTSHSGVAKKAPEQQVEDLRRAVHARNEGEREFLDAVDEVLNTLRPLLVKYPQYIEPFERLVEPERQIAFRVSWIDDNGNQVVNRGYRVQANSALGPYKGGLRFHKDLNMSVVKSLAFEQVFKNSLTNLLIGAAKGGSDFDPTGRSDGEVMRFCQSFMTELYRYLGPDTDIPSGDINVGSREIGYLFGQYKRLTNHFNGAFTGKDLNWGGSNIRPEATGYGLVYFSEYYCNHRRISLKGHKSIVSGSGNVAIYTVEKLLDLGSIPLTLSDSNGYIYEPAGFTRKDLEFIKELRISQNGYLQQYTAYSKTAKYFPNEKPFTVKADFAFPCAIQGEITLNEASTLAKNGIKGVFEGANLPSSNEAISFFKKNQILFAPGKAANAGGVAVSGLEMIQNSQRQQWSKEVVDEKLRLIMKDIFDTSLKAANDFGYTDDIQAGANIAGFLKVADSMIQQGNV
ncbi:NADP-specific glutamate dehydrogenase [Smittium mucronatum]|uniref:Glutamate dehydrogenase n=1 Tax=Smittium mucronatum TaxID=133383 RepID=A0A1R0H6J3_9FUNG|nr:NADP-specific glutamate dehydrogenase [Smittium mucronatum]